MMKHGIKAYAAQVSHDIWMLTSNCQIVRPEQSSTLSSPTENHMSKFALLCQAARLLGEVLQHISQDSRIQDSSWRQLDRTLQSMLTAALNFDMPDNAQIAFIYR